MPPTPMMVSTTAQVGAGKYLTFQLAAETYGVEIGKVREIQPLAPLTIVPRTPAYILGVVNLRGKIVPVIDLRLKFNMKVSAATRETCLIIFEINSAKKTRLLLGILADEVKDVLRFEERDIEAVPDFAVQVDTRFLAGLARSNNNLTLLLDIEKVLNHDELLETQQLQAETPK